MAPDRRGVVTTISVGSLYAPGVTRWPECGQYNFRRGAHELVLFYAAPSTIEIEDVQSGAAEFAVYTSGPLIVLCYQFGRLPWSDAPYSWHLVPPADRDLPSADLEQAMRAVLLVVLVDATTGRVRARPRIVSWSPEFTRALHTAIHHQADRAWDAREYDDALEALYRRYDSTEAIVKIATIRTQGGA